MPPPPANSHPPACKVVVVGPPGSGKAAYVKAVASRHPGSAVKEFRLAECTVVRAEFFDSSQDGETLHIFLNAITGPRAYAAADELLLKGADGIIFLCEAGPLRLAETRESLRAMGEQAEKAGIDLSVVPVSVQYHRADRVPSFNPEQMDHWLGVPAKLVPRYVSPASRPDASGQSYDSITGRIRAGRAGEF